MKVGRIARGGWMFEHKVLSHHVKDLAGRIGMRIKRLVDFLHELEHVTRFLFHHTAIDAAAIDAWLEKNTFRVDPDGFFQSATLLEAYRRGAAPLDAISFSWGKHLKDLEAARYRMYALREIGPFLRAMHLRLEYAAWIYYQDVSNTALQYPYIDQKTAIPWDFDWHQYHTFVSVSPEENPQREIKWTQPTIDYAGEGLILSVSKPLYIDDEFIGLWSIDVPMRNLYADCLENRIFEGQDTFILDMEGRLVAHEQIPARIDKEKGSIYRENISVLGKGFGLLDLESLAEKDAEPFVVVDDYGNDLTTVACGVEDLDWLVFSSVPQQKLSNAIRRRFQSVLRKIQSGDLSDRLQIDLLPDHWREFAETLNDLSQSLQEANRREDHLKAVLRSIRNVNQLIVIEKDRNRLVEQACKILIEERGYAYAAIILLDESQKPDIKSEAGLDAYLGYSWQFDFLPECVCEILEREKTVVRAHPASECKSCPLCDVYHETSRVTVAIEHENVLYGIMTLVVDSNYVRSPQELSLVNELAGDIGLALHGINLGQAQKAALAEINRLNADLDQRIQKRTAELNAANEELASFAYSVSHDLRAPLRGIDGFSQLLFDEYAERLDEDAKHYLERIRTTVQQMSDLIDNLLRLSRVTRAELLEEEFDLSVLVQEVMDKLIQDEPYRKVETIILPNLHVRGSLSLLEAVMVNLLSNAMKFTFRREVARIEFGADQIAGQTRYFVKDNGVGFDMTYQTKLFQPFERLHDRDEYPGSGVGLAIVKRIINRHGGDVWCWAEPEKGAIFSFSLSSGRNL